MPGTNESESLVIPIVSKADVKGDVIVLKKSISNQLYYIILEMNFLNDGETWTSASGVTWTSASGVSLTSDGEINPGYINYDGETE